MKKKLFFWLMIVGGLAILSFCLPLTASAENGISWTDSTYTYDSYLESVDRMERDVQRRSGDSLSHEPDAYVPDDYYPGIPPVPNTYHSRSVSRYPVNRYTDDTDLERYPEPRDDDIEILKAKPLQERDLIRKYKQKIPFDSTLEVFEKKDKQRKAAISESQALIEKYRVPEYRARRTERHARVSGQHWPDLKDQHPLQPRDLIKKYNSIGTPNSRDRDDWKLVEQEPLEDRDLLEKYERIGTSSPQSTRADRLRDREPLQDRNLIQEYNDMGPYNADNADDIEWLEQNPLDDRDLLEKYDDMDISYDEGPPYQREGMIGSLEMGVEAFEYTYEEPDLMDLKGYTYGLFARYTRRLYRNNPLHSWRDIFGNGNGINYVQVEGRGSWGSLDYTSNGTGTHDDENHYAAEIRGLLGYDIPVGREIIFTPFVGFGYRYLLDDSGGETTSTGHLTYDRESQYLYVPLGIEATKYFGQSWSLAGNVEYDFFIRGTQKSHLEDSGYDYETLENDQHDGQGFRGSVKLTKNTRFVDFFLEPFYRYWHIEDSDVSTISYSGIPVGYGLEPENDTHEYGVRLGLQY